LLPGIISASILHHQAESFMSAIAQQYEKRTGHKLEPILCQVVDGAE